MSHNKLTIKLKPEGRKARPLIIAAVNTLHAEKIEICGHYSCNIMYSYLSLTASVVQACRETAAIAVPDIVSVGS